MASTKQRNVTAPKTTWIIIWSLLVAVVALVPLLLLVTSFPNYQKTQLDDKYRVYAMSINVRTESPFKPSVSEDQRYMLYSELVTHVSDNQLKLLHEGAPSTVTASHPLAYQWCEDGNKVSYWSPVSAS